MVHHGASSLSQLNNPPSSTSSIAGYQQNQLCSKLDQHQPLRLPHLAHPALRKGAACETKKFKSLGTSTFSMLRQKVFLGAGGHWITTEPRFQAASCSQLGCQEMENCKPLLAYQGPTISCQSKQISLCWPLQRVQATSAICFRLQLCSRPL